MIHHAAEAVRPGGRLIYSTCSSEPEENEAVVVEFLRTNPGFRPLDLRTERSAHSETIRPVVDEDGFLRTTPDKHGLEAFFGGGLTPCRITGVSLTPLFRMQFRNRVWSAGRLFAIAACLVATYLLFAVTAMRVALKVREVPVPDLRNHTAAEATATLLEEGLVLNVDETRPARSENSRGPHRVAGTCTGDNHTPPAQHSRLAEPGSQNYAHSYTDR